jgi:thiosulfate dehydrogenase [quinone] large subunit
VGLTLTGIGLVVGAAVRWNAFRDTVVTMPFRAASLTGGLMQGHPVAHGRVIDDHVAYAALPFGLGAVGAGRILGVDASLERFEFVENSRVLRLLLLG